MVLAVLLGAPMGAAAPTAGPGGSPGAPSAGAGSSDPASPSGATAVSAAGATSSQRAGIAALLRRRADALLERDKSAFMSTVTGSPSFVARQSHLFDWMRNLPLASYRLDAAWERFGDLARPADRRRYPSADAVSIPVTEERYRIARYDREHAVEDLYYTFVKIDGRWKIASDTDLEGLGFRSVRHLWDFGPLAPSEGGRFLILQHPCTPRTRQCSHLPDAIGPLLQQALDRVRRYWRGSIPGRIVVIVPSTPHELEHLLNATFDATKFIAFTYSSVEGAAAHFQYTAPRMILNWRTLRGRSSSNLLAILTHEMLHVVTRTTAGPFIPVVIEEGFAEHVGNAASNASLAFFRQQISFGLVSPELPEDYEFTSGSGEDIYRSYQAAQSAVSFFVSRWGLDKFTRFYKRLGNRAITPGTVQYIVDKAMRATVGIGWDRFEREWADSIGL